MPIYKVKWDATGAGNGSSWADAYTTPQLAVAAHTAAGDIIEISGGPDGHSYVGSTDFRYGGAAIMRGSSEAGHNGRVVLDGGNSSSTQTLYTSLGKIVENLDITGSGVGRHNLYCTGNTIFNNVNLLGGMRSFSFDAGTIVMNRCFIAGNTDTVRTGTISNAANVTFNDSIYTRAAANLSCSGTASITFNNSIIAGNMVSGAIGIASTNTMTINNSAIYANGGSPGCADLSVITNAGTGNITVKNSLLQTPWYNNTKPCIQNMTDGGGNISVAPNIVSHYGGKGMVALGCDVDARDMGDNDGLYEAGEGTWDAFQELIDYGNPKGLYFYVALERAHLYTTTDWDRIRAWEAAGNEAHAHSFTHMGMEDCLVNGVMRITGPANSTISVTVNKVNPFDFTTWQAAFIMKVNGSAVKTINISYGTTEGRGDGWLAVEINNVAGWVALNKSGGTSWTWGPWLVALQPLTDQPVSTAHQLLCNIDSFMWIDYVECKVMLESELGHEVNFTTYPGGQSTALGRAWLANPANYQGVTRPFLGGRNAAISDGSFTFREPEFRSITGGTVSGLEIWKIHGPNINNTASINTAAKFIAHMEAISHMGGVTMYYFHNFNEVTTQLIHDLVDALVDCKDVRLMLPREIMPEVWQANDLDGDRMRFGYPTSVDYSDYRLQASSLLKAAGISIPAIHEQATPATDIGGNTVHFLPPSIGPYDGQGDTKRIDADYTANAYEVRGTATSPAKIKLGADSLVVDLHSLTADEYIEVKAGSKKVKGFVAKGSNQYLKGSGGSSSNGIFGSIFG